MAEWRNLDTLNAFRALQESDHRADLKTVLSGAAGAERVKKYSVPMAGGLAFNFAAKQVDDEIERLYAPMYVEEGYSWKELNWAIAKCMKNYCGAIKNEALLVQGLDLLNTYRTEIVPKLSCHNTHELVRTHEVLDILTS